MINYLNSPSNLHCDEAQALRISGGCCCDIDVFALSALGSEYGPDSWRAPISATLAKRLLCLAAMRPLSASAPSDMLHTLAFEAAGLEPSSGPGDARERGAPCTSAVTKPRQPKAARLERACI
jgi:hypothetical protein